MKRNTPCKDCKNRELYCHASCKLYIEWKQEQDEVLQEIKKEKQLQRDIEDRVRNVKRRISTRKFR